MTGACWLYCRREGVAVLWVGSVTTPGATGDVYACGPCLAELDHMVRALAHGRDGITNRAAQSATLAVPAHMPPPRAACGRFGRPSPATAPYAEPAPCGPSGRDDAMTGTGTKTCEHRQTERRDGKTYCRECKRQLYL
ncbi:hypothetical protein [Streptomyces prunicolor]|uniref:hypothetical protein n=1 Tax=Streptomyces prunicolor TaxID=67348 RepID=UPI000363B7B1|nr:hypothetical protein [Streptomyces prunicolor]